MVVVRVVVVVVIDAMRMWLKQYSEETTILRGLYGSEQHSCGLTRPTTTLRNGNHEQALCGPSGSPSEAWTYKGNQCAPANPENARGRAE